MVKRRKDKPKIERRAFAFDLKWWTVLIMALILGALASNILALIYPFLEFSAAFKGRERYSIPHTIELMWNFDLYAIAILIVAFSLTFPFVKLIMLTTILWLPMTRQGRSRTLSILRQLGRWSLLDVFIALIILVLADDQIFIGATPKIGVTYFLAAICTSMFTCELLEYFNLRTESHPTDPLKGRYTPVYWAAGWLFWLMIPLLILSIASLLVALGLPYFQISEFLLKHKSYSVIKSITALLDSGWWIFAYSMLAFLVVFPLLRLVTLGVLGFVPLNRFFRRVIDRWTGIIGAWSMLDVFGLALLLFLTEGANLVGFDIHKGLYVIIASVLIYYITAFIAMLAIRRVLRRSHTTADSL